MTFAPAWDAKFKIGDWVKDQEGNVELVTEDRLTILNSFHWLYERWDARDPEIPQPK